MNSIRWTVKDRKSAAIIHLTQPTSDTQRQGLDKVLRHLGAMPKGKRRSKKAA